MSSVCLISMPRDFYDENNGKQRGVPENVASMAEAKRKKEENSLGIGVNE